MSDLLRLITLQDSNTRVVLLGATLLGLAAGIIGSFAVLRRRALVGDALAHAALPGICVAYFVVGDRDFTSFLVGAFVFGVLGVLCISLIRRYTRVKEDAAIGIVLSTFFGLGIVLSRIIQNQPGGNRAGLDTFLFGKAAGMVREDVRLIALVGAVAIIVVVILFKEFKLLCFDREFAGSLGRPLLILDLALMGLICVCTVIGLPAVGVVLMAALLIIPAAAARFWTDKLWVMVCIAGAAGAVSGLTGTAISALVPRLSAGPLVALTATAFFTISLLAAPQRGIVARWVRQHSLRRKIIMQNFLRALYELGEAQQASAAPRDGWSETEVALKRSWSRPQLDAVISRAAADGLIERRGAGWALTKMGLIEAIQTVRAHRLWEVFLIDQADIAPDHVDRDADLIEHILPRELLLRLEEKLRAQGRLPEHIPGSPHAIARHDSAGARA